MSAKRKQRTSRIVTGLSKIATEGLAQCSEVSEDDGDSRVVLYQLKKNLQYLEHLKNTSVEIHYYNKSLTPTTFYKAITSVVFKNDDYTEETADLFTYQFRHNQPSSNLQPIPEVDVKWLRPNLENEMDERKWTVIKKILNMVNTSEIYFSDHEEECIWNPKKDAEAKADDSEKVTFLDLISSIDDHLTQQELLDMAKKAKAGYINEVVYLMQHAFTLNMNDVAGRDGVMAFLQLAAELIDKSGIDVQSLSDQYASNLTLIPAKVDLENYAIESGLPPPVAGSSSSCLLCSSYQATSHINKRRKIIENIRSHSDIAVFSMLGPEAEPLLVVEVMSRSNCDEFLMFKHLLSALLLKNEAFALLINAADATIYRMIKKIDEKQVIYSSKPYLFETTIHGKQVFETKDFIELFEDILKILQYGINQSRVEK